MDWQYIICAEHLIPCSVVGIFMHCCGCAGCYPDDIIRRLGALSLPLDTDQVWALESDLLVYR